jgi:hypothetical protein
MQKFRARLLPIAIGLVLLTAAGCGGGGGQSPAQAKSQITATWEAVFAPNSSPNLIQGMTPQLQTAFQKSKAASSSTTAQVTSVQLLSSSDCKSNNVPTPCAKVTYNLSVKGTVVLNNSQGYATRVGGKWLVSKTTFCALLALGSGGVPPAGC